MNYLELTNNAIRESGYDIDDILIGDFLAPLDVMQTRFKRWVNQAWREIQQERNEWQFRRKKAQLIISPRFLVAEGDRATPPPVGSEYVGDDTETEFTVLGVTTLSGDWAVGNAEAWLDFEEYSNDLPIKWNEYFDEVSPTPANVNVFRAKWFGRYDLMAMVPDCLEPDLNTFFIQSTGGSSQQDNTSAADNRILSYSNYTYWLVGPENDQTGRGRPYTFTTTPEGYFDFYPRPDKQYVLTFDYSVKPQELALAADTPEVLPANYHDMIVWRTVMYYAQYSDKPQLFISAQKRYETYKNRLERNQLPPLSWGANLYNYYSAYR